MDAPISTTTAERWLALFLRFSGGVMLMAFLAVLMPTSWMAASNTWLGLGDFPASPLVDYLTRTNSLLYGMHGGLLLVVARNVQRYAGVILYLAWIHVVFGISVVAVDALAGMPPLWTAVEGPPVIAAGVIAWMLVRRIDPATSEVTRSRSNAFSSRSSQPVRRSLGKGLTTRSTAVEN